MVISYGVHYLAARSLSIADKSNADKLHHILARIGLCESPKANIHLRFKAICNDTSDCRALTEIATELSLTRKYLTYWFQTKCNLISLKHRQSVRRKSACKRKEQILLVRNITWRFYSQGLYPSNRKVAEVLAPLKLSFLKQYIRAIHRKTLRELSV